MKKFEKPEMEVIVFEAEDIITESTNNGGYQQEQEPKLMGEIYNVDGEGIETPIPKPTETSMPEPTETSTPEPTETSTPEPTETSTQVPVDPGYTNGPGEM